MTRKTTEVRSDIAWSTPEKIGVHGYDLTEDLMGKVNFGDMAYLSVTGNLPDAGTSRMFNAILLTLVEHGMVPSTIAARMTYIGAPESMQAAVAAGLLGLGTVFVGSTEGAAKMLKAALPDAKAEADLDALAKQIVREHRERRAIVPGLGHPVHKPVDPRTIRLFAVAKETGIAGKYMDLMQRVAKEAEAATGKSLPINATGAIGALVCEMGLPWEAARGLGVMARAVGLVGHILEESRRPMSMELWHRIEEEASSETRGKLRGK
jgi:citrate synthase